MVELISIHIPKTGGSSFYHILQQVYKNQVSISYKRRDIKPLLGENQLTSIIQSAPLIKVVHGHFYYQELKVLHTTSDAKLICWLRDPIERVYSNYKFFINGLQNPERNPKQYEINKHRINETFLEYASLSENQNRMSKFLAGLSLQQIDFIGFLEDFETDLMALSKLLNWPNISIPHLNKLESSNHSRNLNFDYQQIAALNSKDITLYKSAKEIKSSRDR